MSEPAWIDPSKAAQIVNNVAEEFVDLGRTNFATKGEFCETILWLRGELDQWIQRANAYRAELALLSAHATVAILEIEQLDGRGIVQTPSIESSNARPTRPSS